MSSTVATMPSSISSGSTEHRRNPSEAGTHGFTAVNITPPHSRGTHESRMMSDKTNARPESSATSPDLSPRHNIAGAGRNANQNGSSSNFYTNGHDHPQLKRQRSMSSEQGPRSPRRYDYHPPRKADSQQHMADRALHVLDSANQPPPYSYYSTTPAVQDRPGQQYERSYSNTNGMHSTSEGRASDTFQRDSSEHHYASSATGGDHDKNDDSNDRSANSQNGQKRKRNFSNRTKTGCITCRSRKKKCDEGRPHCNNCIRGSFPCQGYNHSRPGSWPKPTPQKQPIPLQSKESDDPSVYQGETPVSANPANLETSQLRPSMATDGHDQSRPHYASHPSAPADLRPPYSGQQQHNQQWTQHPSHSQHSQHPPPQQPQSQPQQQSQPQHGPSPQSSYHSDHLPPFSELTRSEQQQSQQQQQPQQQHHPRPDYSATPHREMSRPSTQQNNLAGPPQSAASTPSQWQQPVPQYQSAPQQQEYGSRPNPYPPRIDTTQSQHLQTNAVANTANTASASYSSYEQKASSKLFTEKDVERSRMLRGALYNYFDPTLRSERQRCATALARYNKACEWGSGVSDNELQNMLLKVFDPQLDFTHSFLAASREKGSIGGGVKIEAGFRCTYGYNLRIYDNVFIGENTRIDDSAKVEIGSRTWIGPDVKILTNDIAKDLVQRKGTDGQQCQANGVTIGSEVVIGTGAVIYPGIRLGKGSTVEPFAIVRQDLGDYVTQKAAVGPQMGGVIG